MKWNISGDRPIYQQLYEQLTERVVSGIYAPNTKMPAVRELAAEAGVNPNTMQRALTDLERDGLLYTQRTAGRFVTEDTNMIAKLKEQVAQSRIQDFLGSMKILGYNEEEILKLLQTIAKGEKKA